MSQSKAWIAGTSGERLTAEERRFFGDEQPWGFILFDRNIAHADQVRDLVADLRDSVGRNAPIFIDQEGGRIQRLNPPIAPRYPAPANLGRLFAFDSEEGRRAAWLQGRLLAADLGGFGISANCIPCIDVPVEGAHSVIGDRAYAMDPDVVTTLGRAAAEGLMAGGVLPVMKHIPGHGRGNADSHLRLPVVETSRAELERTDFAPFRSLRTLACAMTAHILYSAVDPKRPATLSPIVVDEIIRGHIGFDGLLMTDDISMKALNGDIGELSRAAIGAGCDIVLHCNGDMSEMRKVAAAVPPLSGKTERRCADAENVIDSTIWSRDMTALRAEFESLVVQAA